MKEDLDSVLKEFDTSVFSLFIRKHVETILLQPSIGLGHRAIEVMNPRTSFGNYSSPEYNCDRFQMIIPYAGTPLECVVIFQSSGPDCPPDFVFSDGRFFAPIGEMDSLKEWDVKKPDGLLRTIKEIVQFYKKTQIQELDKYEVLSFEYLCLFQLQTFNEDDIEILVPPDQEAPVIFLLRLHVDFHSYFPDFFEEGTKSEECPLLFVSFSNRESNKSHQRLYLSKNIETLLGVDETFQLSEDLTDNYLIRYIIAIEDDLKSRAGLAASRYEKRKVYFIKFLSHFVQSVIEYDILFYTNMVLLLKDEEFFFIVEINLPDDYPLETPALVFRSIYHTFMGEPVAVAIDSYPYSPSWPIHTVLQETVKFITEYVPLFRQDSTPTS